MAAVVAWVILLLFDFIVSTGSGQPLSGRPGVLAVVRPDVGSGPRIVQGGRSPGTSLGSFGVGAACGARMTPLTGVAAANEPASCGSEPTEKALPG